jgi:putative DNA primase/helicase
VTTHSKNVELLLEAHGDDMLWCQALGGWLVWTGVRWEQDEHQPVRWEQEVAPMWQKHARAVDATTEDGAKKQKRLFAWAAACESTGNIKATLELARSQENVSVSASAFDSTPGVLGVANGVMVLGRTRATYKRPNRDYRLTRLTRAMYKKDGTAPTWTCAMKTWIPDSDLRAWVQRLVGYSLLDGNPERVLVFVVGPSSTGKSTFLETLADVLGDAAGAFDLSMLRAKQDEGARADVVSVMSRRLIHTSEASSEWNLHADHIKRMTGGDTVKARRLYSSEFVERKPSFTPWIATNAVPHMSGADAALRRRLYAVPFVAEDFWIDDLPARLRRERDGILRWCLEGYAMYRRDGIADAPEAALLAKLDVEDRLTPVARWVRDCCEHDASYEEPFGVLEVSYKHWQEAEDLRPAERIGRTKLRDTLTDLGFASVTRKAEGTDRNVAYRAGLRLVPEARHALETLGVLHLRSSP